MLGLASNGAGVVGVFDPKNGFAFKVGFQQSNTDATNLSESIFSLAEAGYVARPPGLAEGNYRVWFRSDNSTGASRSRRSGVSLDQKLTPHVRAVRPVRLGRGRRRARPLLQRSASRFRMAPSSTRWTSGASATRRPSSATGDSEKLVEGYYNFQMSEKLRLSFHLQHVLRDAGRRRRRSASWCLACGCRRGSSVHSGQEDTHGKRKTVSHRRRAGRGRRRRAGRRRALRARRRQGRRSDVGRHDRQSRLERHRVHGHQDQEDRRQDVPRQQRQPAHGDDVAGRPLRRHRRHAREQGVHHRRADAAAGQGDPRRHRAGAPGVLAGQPLVLSGQSRRRLDLGDRHGLADEDQDDSRPRRAAQRHVSCRTARRPTSATTARTGSASSTSGATSC